MVEISGQAGIVKRVSMRFTIIENALGAQVHIPNRSICSLFSGCYPDEKRRCHSPTRSTGKDTRRCAGQISYVARQRGAH